MDNWIELTSVGCYINQKNGMVCPAELDGLDDDINTHNLADQNDDYQEEWFSSLSIKDRVVVLDIIKDESGRKK